jgi:DNA damage-inducible protein 1
MLYISVEVNGHPIKAFVDSGAQSTIMSPDCAESCGLSYLIDENFSGIARGVGTAKILGKIHNAKMQVGDAELDCAFTVMEGKSVDLLFGLDMLKRHQAAIDLQDNVLRFPHTTVHFLPESEIPKKELDSLMDEPTVTGPNGLEIGANSGTIRPAGAAQAARESLQAAKDRGESMHQNVGGSSGNGSGTQQQPAGPGAAPAAAPSSNPRYSDSDISHLMALGFTRQEAISALDATEGNLEYAAGLLFR